MNETVQPPGIQPVTTAALEASVARAADALLADQHPDGYWLYQLEADATIPAEYVLLGH